MIYRKDQIQELVSMGQRLRRDCIECIGVGVTGHVGGSCSAADLTAALYFYKLKYNPEDPLWEGRDYFLLSKGHVAILQYSALAELGVIPKDDLHRCKELGFYLQGHPHLGTPGVEAGTGSLGQGLSLALGIALGLRMDHKTNRVYVMLGDGELDEGQIWEAAMAAGNFRTGNLCAIIDCNGIQCVGPTAERMNTSPLADKWNAFGWNVIECDGHDMQQIVNALDQAEACTDRPTVLIAHTIKGKGISFAENVPSFHNAALTQEQYDLALQELSGEVD